MKITVKLSKHEAQKILGDAFAREFNASAARYRIESVEWTSYGSTVEIELTDEPSHDQAADPVR